MIQQNEVLKRCSKCGVWKPHIEFHKSPDRRSGLKPRCKKCRKKSSEARRTKYRERNRERDVTIGPPKKCSRCGKQKPRIRFHKNIVKRDGLQPYCKECTKAYYLKVREKIRTQQRGYYLQTREERNERQKKYYAENREEIKVREWLHHNYSGVLDGDGCCMWPDCYEIRVFRLNNHHVWGRKNSDETFTFCEDHHSYFTRNKNAFIDFW